LPPSSSITGDADAPKSAHGGRRRQAREVVRRGEKAVASRLTPLKAVPWWNVLTAVVTLVAVAFMLSAIAALPEAFSQVSTRTWAWIIPAVVLASLIYVGYAISLAGSVLPRIPLFQGSEIMLAESFTNMATPAGMGSIAVTTRFLQLQGVEVATALSSSSLGAVAASLVQAVAFLVCTALSAGTFSTKNFTSSSGSSGGNRWIILVVVIGVAAAVAVVVWIPRVRGRVIPPVARALRNLLKVLRQPKKGAELLGGQTLSLILQAACLASCLRLVDTSTSFSVLVVVTVLALGAQYAVPVPGALGAPEAILVAGLTAAGVAQSPAVAAVATYRMLVYWLPAIPGWLLLRSLRHRHVL
jgi:glycosyltransferase 2 family protein